MPDLHRWDAEPVIITVAPSGAEVTRQHNPAVPYTPAEIAEQTAAAYEAGAAHVHLHVREDDGTPTHRLPVFAETVRLIRERCPIVTEVSTGGAVWMTMAQRMECLEAGAEMSGVEPGSLNFDGQPFVTTRADGQAVVRRATELGMALEAECFDLGHVAETMPLLRSVGVERLPYFNLVVGVPGGAPATPEALTAMVAALPTGARWTVTAVGRHQARMLALALVLGSDGIRVGFEDNVYLRRGHLAASNAELVEGGRRLVESLGRRVATIEEARARLLG